MRTLVVVVAALLLSGGVMRAAEVQYGSTVDQVRAAMGVPRGQVTQAGRQVLYYERGEVELQDGVVRRVSLRTPEEQEEWVARSARANEERAARRAELIAAGTELRDRRLADPAFKDAPLAYQVSFWEDLAARFPDVSVVEPLAIARMRLAEQQREQRRREEAEAAEHAAQLAAAEREQTYYPVFTGYPYRRYHPYYPPRLGPFEYNFNSTSLAPYSTPSGNPAGNLRNPVEPFPSYVLPPGSRARPDGDWHGREQRDGRDAPRGFEREWRAGM